MDTFRGSVDDRLDPFDVGLPSPVGTAVGVGYLDAESDFLAAIIAFCHVGTSFALMRKQINRRIISQVEGKCKCFFKLSGQEKIH